MHGKRVLTLGCAVAILAFGACFGPPPPSPSPPPPPPPPLPHLKLPGARRILVTVTNESTSRHVDPAALGRCIAEAVNVRTDGSPRADTGREAKAGNAVLQVSIEKEEALPEAKRQPEFTTWRFAVTLSATLAGADQTVVWSEPSHVYEEFGRAPHDADPWTSVEFADRLRIHVCGPLITQMLYGGKLGMQ
jgi:hypothetical protein